MAACHHTREEPAISSGGTLDPGRFARVPPKAQGMAALASWPSVLREFLKNL